MLCLSFELKSRNAVENDINTIKHLLAKEPLESVINEEKHNAENGRIFTTWTSPSPIDLSTIPTKTTQTSTYMRCCHKIIIASNNPILHSNVPGSYVLQSRDDDRIIYKRTDKDVFLSQPSVGSRKFAWGVNSNPDKTWGWVRAGADGDCPDAVPVWMVFDKTTNRRTVDKHFNVSCESKLLYK